MRIHDAIAADRKRDSNERTYLLKRQKLLIYDDKLYDSVKSLIGRLNC